MYKKERWRLSFERPWWLALESEPPAEEETELLDSLNDMVLVEYPVAGGALVRSRGKLYQIGQGNPIIKEVADPLTEVTE